jgi:hypothetical protein
MRPLPILVLIAGCAVAQEAPQAEISNEKVKAKLYLPDNERGYYRATRFDWSGVVSSLQAGGHEYFGVWFPRYNPKTHDAITGPVEEFLASQGYDEAKPGESFVRIGVGALKKPEEAAYRQFGTYEITDPGKWTVKRGADWIEFTHELSDTRGYAYLYTKRVSLTPGKSEMVLQHTLKNTGKKTLASNVYDHNFYMLDTQPTSADIAVKLPFALTAKADLKGLAEIRGKDLAYLAELKQGQTVYTELEGYGPGAADYDIRVENRKTGAGVRQRSDRPIAKLVLWSIRTTVCPEAYVDVRVEPGKEATWRIQYEFYSL